MPRRALFMATGANRGACYVVTGVDTEELEAALGPDWTSGLSEPLAR